MKKNDAISLINGKVDDLKSIIATLKTDESISKNTRSTQLYARGKERKTLHLINSLVGMLPDEFKLTEDDMNTFVLLTTLSTERASSSAIVIKEGDSIMELLMNHPNLNKKKLEEKCQKAGLVMDFTKGILVKA